MLTIGDRALLRELFTWARANGWRPVETDRKSREWTQVNDLDAPNVNLVKREYGPDYDLRVYEDDPGRRTFVESTSVRRAIDVLAAIGVLPAEFFYAFRGGEVQYNAHIINAGLTLPLANDDTWADNNVNVQKLRRHCSPWLPVETGE